MTSDLSPQCAADATLQLNRPRALFPFSLLLSVKHPKPESGRQREMVVGMVRLQQAESVFSSTVGETPLQVLSCRDGRRNTSILLSLLLSGVCSLPEVEVRDFVVRYWAFLVGVGTE